MPRCTPRRSAHAAARVALLAAPLLLAACAELTLGDGAVTAAPLIPVAGAAVATPGGADALGAFAAATAPGQVGVLVENGVGQRARLARAYQAASGRECREVILGSGAGERSRLACRGEDGRFAEARPLLRGGR